MSHSRHRKPEHPAARRARFQDRDARRPTLTLAPPEPVRIAPHWNIAAAWLRSAAAVTNNFL